MIIELIITICVCTYALISEKDKLVGYSIILFITYFFFWFVFINNPIAYDFSNIEDIYNKSIKCYSITNKGFFSDGYIEVDCNSSIVYYHKSIETLYYKNNKTNIYSEIKYDIADTRNKTFFERYVI